MSEVIKKGYSEFVRIPIGPIHPALHEPYYFFFELDGEEIKNVWMQSGGVHRGMEALALNRNYLQIIPIAERICGICSNSHPLAYTMAVEDAAGIEVPERAQYIRVIAQELERIHSHILWAGLGGHAIGLDTAFYYLWRLREDVLDIWELLFGGRVTHAVNWIGGTKKDIKEEDIPKVLRMLKNLRKALPEVVDAFLHDPTIVRRLRAGVLTRRDALRLSAVGPTARGSGVKKDARWGYGALAYGNLRDDYGYKPIIHHDGDVYAKTYVRLMEVEQSIDIIEKALDDMPSGPYRAIEGKAPKVIATLKKVSGAEGIGRHEAPRGEVIHYVRMEGGEGPYRWRPRAPSLNNNFTLPVMLKGCQVADIPIVVASIDPCFSCTDRMTFIDENHRKFVLSYEQLVQISREATWRDA
ncbi:MAG: rane-bound hydrogenase subunit alpha [Archaeoglobi archaeon]|nr:rane-bound hydrogenase subunit alpha [Archaeoglobi archaeon]MDK2781066.1 rane-bound hydrogenase subunit alpha [Archaeoglobi archaeon]